MSDRRRLVPNPDWATKILTNFYGHMVGDLHLPLEMLPQITDLRPAVEGDGADISARMEEYGCGVYGCVYPTNDSKVVLKLTADSTEAEFAEHWASRLVRPICVTYYKVAKPRGAKDDKGHPVWCLWRESAYGIGQLNEYVSEEAQDLLNLQHRAAQEVDKGWRKKIPHDEMRRRVNAWWESCEDMLVIPKLEPLAEGMMTVFREQGIFFGDIHQDNIGMVYRGEPDCWVITDPGNIAIASLEEVASLIT